MPGGIVRLIARVWRVAAVVAVAVAVAVGAVVEVAVGMVSVITSVPVAAVPFVLRRSKPFCADERANVELKACVF